MTPTPLPLRTKLLNLRQQNRLLFLTAALCCLPAQATENQGFLQGAAGDLLLRNFYFNHDFRSSGYAQSKQDEWAQVFLLKLQSGYTPGVVGLGADLIGQLGAKLDSSPDRTGSGLLPKGSEGHAPDDYSRLGFAAKAKISKTVLKIGELQPDLPVLKSNVVRALPQTFQGGMLTSRDLDNFTLHAGQFRSLSHRNQSGHGKLHGLDFQGESDRFNYAGAEYFLNRERTSISYWHAQLQDIYRQNYYSLNHIQPMGDWTLSIMANLFVNRDEGSAKGGDIDNKAFSTLLSARHGGHTFHTGFQRITGDQTATFIAFTMTPLANDMQARPFHAEDERSWQLRYDYDFAGLGLPGLESMVRYARGDNVHTRQGYEGKEWERDIDLSYTVQGGPLKNLNIRWRNAMVRANFGQRDFDENRLIISYNLPLF